VYVLPLSPLFGRFYNILELSFVSPYNHLLFLAKTNKENDNNIDFSLSIGQNLLKKYFVNFGFERNEATSGSQVF
jgi:hypothetical protein